VAVGSFGKVVTSEDGINWIEQNSGTSNYLCKVIFTNPQFVTVGLGQILISSKGISWIPQNTPTTEFIQGVTVGGTTRNQTIIAVGRKGTVITSPLGATTIPSLDQKGFLILTIIIGLIFAMNQKRRKVICDL